MKLSDLIELLQSQLTEHGDQEAHVMCGVKIESPGVEYWWVEGAPTDDSMWSQPPVAVWESQFFQTDGPLRIGRADWSYANPPTEGNPR